MTPMIAANNAAAAAPMHSRGKGGASAAGAVPMRDSASAPPAMTDVVTSLRQVLVLLVTRFALTH